MHIFNVIFILICFSIAIDDKSKKLEMKVKESEVEMVSLL